MPDGLFQVGTASALDPAIPWDVVICRSLAGNSDLDHSRGLLARMFAKATHAIALLGVPEERRQWMLHALAEIGANAIQMESVKETNRREVLSEQSESKGDTFNVFARV